MAEPWNYIVITFIVLVIFSNIVAWIGYLQRYINGHLRVLRKHIGAKSSNTVCLSQSLYEWEYINVYLALESLRREANTELLSVTPLAGMGLKELTNTTTLRGLLRKKRVIRGLNRYEEIAENVIHLLRHQGRPFCAYLSHVPFDAIDAPASVTSATMEVLAVDQEFCRTALELVLKRAREVNVYRGQVLALTELYPNGDQYKLEFQDIPLTQRQEIVLPEDVLQVAERNILSVIKYAETLRQRGQTLRHGVLLHGPPGTGKTLLTRYLLHASKDCTTILMTGKSLRFVREAMMMARLLAPSFVVLEDVDLIAEDRTTNRFGGILQDLLEAMDGLGRKSECIILMTTNRPELLEPALANRPGRIDQAIHVGLPDATCRGRLLDLYSQGLALNGMDRAAWIEKTEGVSPAFLAEWMRRAALMAAERGETASPLPVTCEDLERAFRELVVFGGLHGQTILGFRPPLATRN